MKAKLLKKVDINTDEEKLIGTENFGVFLWNV